MFLTENLTNKFYKALIKFHLKVYEEEKCCCLNLPFYNNQTSISKGSFTGFFGFCLVFFWGGVFKSNQIIILFKKMKIYFKQYIRLAIVISNVLNLIAVKMSINISEEIYLIILKILPTGLSSFISLHKDFACNIQPLQKLQQKFYQNLVIFIYG